MKFKEKFLKDIEEFNGNWVEVKITLIDETNHPLGALGMMLMGNEIKEKNIEAINIHNNDITVTIEDNNTIQFYAYLEIIKNVIGEKILIINDSFESSCMEIFRPSPPLVIGDIDVSLWWSYHSLDENTISQLELVKQYVKTTKYLQGDAFPIRDICIEGISHCE